METNNEAVIARRMRLVQLHLDPPTAALEETLRASPAAGKMAANTPGRSSAAGLLPSPPSSASRNDGRGLFDATRFDRGEMTRFLVSSEFAVRTRMHELFKEPLFQTGTAPSDTKEFRELSLKRVLRIIQSGVVCSNDLRNNPTKYIAVTEEAGYLCSSMTTAFGVQMSLFTGSVLNLGTEKHHKLIVEAVDRGEAMGCFAMTEFAHGSNVAALQTVCEYRKSYGDFLLRTPDDSAQKFWIGNAAGPAVWATVFARLHYEAEDKGVHAFLVQLRDPKTMALLPNIRIADNGPKLGLNGVANGRIWFDNVVLSKDALLDRFAKIDSSGRYVNSCGTANKLFAQTVGELSGGRVVIATGTTATAQLALLIGIRYASQRLQFGPPGKAEIPILDYAVHTCCMMRLLATTVIHRVACNKLKEMYAAHILRRGEDEQIKRRVHVSSCGLKAVCSWHCLNTFQAVRELGGGHLYAEVGRMGMRSSMDVCATYEGANHVLLQQITSSLLKEFKDQFSQSPVLGAATYINQRFTFAMLKNPIITHMSSDKAVMDPSFWTHAFEYREFKLTRRLAKILRRAGRSTFFDVWNRNLNLVTELALAHVDRTILTDCLESIAKAPHQLQGALQTCLAVWALGRLKDAMAFFLTQRYIAPNKATAVSDALERLCIETMRPMATDLVECFGIPDHVVFAPQAFDYAAACKYEISRDGPQPVVLRP